MARVAALMKCRILGMQLAKSMKTITVWYWQPRFSSGNPNDTFMCGSNEVLRFSLNDAWAKVKTITVLLAFARFDISSRQRCNRVERLSESSSTIVIFGRLDSHCNEEMIFSFTYNSGNAF